MKAIIVDGSGVEGVRVEEIGGLPEPGRGMVKVRCRAWSLNYRDLMVAEGRYGRPLEKPQIAGSDMAGEVVSVGPGVEGLAEGDKVINTPITSWVAGEMGKAHTRNFLGGGGVQGVFSDETILPAEALVKFERLTMPQAATLPVAGLTAWAALVTRGGLRPGGTVLCLGTGGVSIFAAQIAHAMKCKVIITSSSDEKLQRCEQVIPSDIVTINYAKFPEWHRAVMEVTNGDGVDVVVETVGGTSLAKSIESVRYGGTVSVIGILEGVQSEVSLAKILSRLVRLRGIYMESCSELREFVKFMDVSHIRPIIDRHFEFGEARDAYKHLKSQRHFGKIVLESE